jgi:hypothetical protein
MDANVPTGSGGRPNQSDERLPTELIAFAVRKEAHSKELAKRFNAQMPPVVWAYFEAAAQGNWPEAARLGEELRHLSFPPGLPKPDPIVTSQVWSAVMEIFMAFAQFAIGDPKYAFRFGQDIIRSIPSGSIFFGGTDAGRGLVTALCRSHETGDPFFTLTQNALGDRPYLLYLREIYGRSIFIPSDEDLQQARDEYQRDLERREREHELVPGERVERVDGKIQCTTVIAGWAVNSALARLIFDRNPDRQFFVEESFHLEWMYPHLVPHGLVMAICRQPLVTLPPELVEQDRKYWSDQIAEMLGDWLRLETPVSEVCAFAEKVFLRKDLGGFTGDPKYVASEPACHAFSKLRTAIAGLYGWRMRNDSDPAAQRRMAEAADFACRQAFVLSPRSPEAAIRCMGHYLSENRPAEALLVVETASRLAPENNQLQSWLQSLARKVRNEQA